MIIDTLFLDKRVAVDDEVSYILDRLDVPVQKVPNAGHVFAHINRDSDPVSRAKRTLFITLNQGAVIKPCPGTREYTCCDYTILHTGTFCSMDCSYCILQAYFHPPVMQYFAGLDRLKSSLEKVFSQEKILRIGTGEFTDSLIWEPISMQPKFLVELFASQSTCVLELKTKTVNIDSLLCLDHNKKTILSWSLNTPLVIKSEERGTTGLTARLKAAARAQQAGYPVAFHFDPLVIYDGCIQEYKSVIEQVFNYVSPDTICWISMGSFRFMPQLKSIIENRFPGSSICFGEFIPGLDNKMRYFKPLRIELYRELIRHIKSMAPDVLVYFCMEDCQVWEQSTGFFPSGEKTLAVMLDKSAAFHCQLKQGAS